MSSTRIWPAVAKLAPVILFALILMCSRLSQAQTYTLLHSFTQGRDGAGPTCGVTLDPAGNLYGTASSGAGGNCPGTGCGAVFRLAQKNGAWVFTPLYDFQGGGDGATPIAAVTIGPDGAVYGTTISGGGNGCGGNGCGTIFRLTPPASVCHSAMCGWAESLIYRFQLDPNGLAAPYAGVTFDTAGNLYGQTRGGGAYGRGAVYKLTRSGGSWTLSVIYNFTGGDDGAVPNSRLTMDRAGNLYGTTFSGGAYGYGTVFELVRSGVGWTFHLLYGFQGESDGGNPYAGVVLDSAGNIYGDNSTGGQYSGGVVYELSLSGGAWMYSVLYDSTSMLYADLGIDGAGNLYGTAYAGGSQQDGLVFELSPAGGGWTETNLYSFTGPDGAFPISSVALDASGNLYGTTNQGGSDHYGVVWQFAR